MQLKELAKRAQQLIDQSSAVLSTRTSRSGIPCVDSAKLAGLRASVLSFIAMVYGREHSHYSEFNSATKRNYESSAKMGNEILLSIQGEIEGGWIFSVKQLVSAEIFSDFLDMAGHLSKARLQGSGCCNGWQRT